MDYVNTFDNWDELRNGIITDLQDIGQCFHQLFPGDSEQIHLQYIIQGFFYYYLYHKITGSAEALKNLFVNARV